MEKLTVFNHMHESILPVIKGFGLSIYSGRCLSPQVLAEQFPSDTRIPVPFVSRRG